MPVYAHRHTQTQHRHTHTDTLRHTPPLLAVCVPGGRALWGKGIYLANAENTLDLFAFDFARCQRHFEEFSTFDKVKGLFASH